MIPDGTYDVFVVDATARDRADDPDTGATAWTLELTILAGEHKGDVLAVRADGLRGTELDLIGMPGTLVVRGGEPSFRLDA